MHIYSLLVLLPAFFFLFAGGIGKFCVSPTQVRTAWQMCLLAAFTTTSLWAGLGVVLLSLVHELDRTGLALWWVAGIGILTYVKRDTRKSSTRLRLPRPLWSTPLSCTEKLAAGSILLGLGASLAMGVLYPPNNGDSLIYHLPRQLLWISERTVWPRAMPFSHMSMMPPLTEWISVNFYLLSGSDRFSFLVQWLSYVICLAALNLVLLQDQANRTSRLYACAFFALLPAAFFQASNNKNDVFLTAWLLILWLVMRQIISVGRNGVGSSLAAGVAAGCACLAKGTAWAYLPSLGAVSAIRFIASGAKLGIAGCAMFAMSALEIASLHYLPAWVLSLQSDPSPANSTLNAALFSPATAASVLIRNLALQFALPFETWNHALEAVANSAVGLLGFSPSDPDSTFVGTRFAVRYTPLLEDSATAFGHFLLAVLLCAGGFLRLHNGSERRCAAESAALFVLSVLLFSVIFRWQPWHSRLLIPAVAFAAPGVGLMIAAWRPRLWAAVTMMALLLWFLPSLGNWSRPLVGKVTPWTLDEDAAVGRAGSGAFLLPAFGHAMQGAGVTTVWLDVLTSPVHAALRYLPLSTRYGFPSKGAPTGEEEAVLTNVADASLSPYTQTIIRKLVPVVDLEGWRLFLRPGAYQRLSREGALPPFSGVTVIAGLDPMQGPYPEFHLPLFANIRPRGAVFEPLPGTRPGLLRVAVARYARPCRLSVIVDGMTRGVIVVDDQTRSSALELPLDATATPRRIELQPEDASSRANPASEFSARLLKLQIVPATDR